MKKTRNYIYRKTKTGYRIRMHPWESDEDKSIRKHIEKYGLGRWVLCAKVLNALYHSKKHVRSPRQCREHWKAQLDPKIRRGYWTSNEDNILIQCQSDFGNKWSSFEKYLPGRTENMIKNRFHALSRPPKTIKEEIVKWEDIQESTQTTIKIETSQVKEEHFKEEQNFYPEAHNIFEEESDEKCTVGPLFELTSFRVEDFLS